MKGPQTEAIKGYDTGEYPPAKNVNHKMIFNNYKINLKKKYFE